ncbi:MAG: hypothetical protein QM791_00330 [Ferruginibacter sp.]
MSNGVTRGKLLVIVGNESANLYSIPVRIDILSATLKPLKTQWLRNFKFQTELETGLYLVRMQCGDRKSQEQITKVTEGETTQINFNDLSNAAFRGKNFRQQFAGEAFGMRGLLEVDERYSGNTEFRMYNFKMQQWVPLELHFEEGTIEGVRFASGEQQVLELKSGSEFQYKIIPASGAQLFGFISASPNNGYTQSNIEVSIKDETVRSLLSFITIGNIQQAKSLHAEYAERFLYEKLDNPVYAAVGGYYLLKIKDLGRIHHWANNLADWFTNLPDGPVIHAWQMILQGETETAFIKERLLQAFKRGVPLFTEGLRLLYEGLNMLGFTEEYRDSELQSAIKAVRACMQLADMRQPHTTLFTTNPAYIDFNTSPWFIRAL